MTLEARLAVVRGRIAAAARSAGRDPARVRLLAVSKRHHERAIRRAYAAGQRDFGENYVQELEAKAAALADLSELRWHFIGHLQRNKAKAVVAVGATVSTLDSSRLAEALCRRARSAGTVAPVLLQVNVGREPQKSGCRPDALGELLASARACPGLRVEGLMTVPPATGPEEARPHFRVLRELADEHGLRELSMGMSTDLEVAIEEGATVVRVGTAIFGPRPS